MNYFEPSPTERDVARQLAHRRDGQAKAARIRNQRCDPNGDDITIDYAGALAEVCFQTRVLGRVMGRLEFEPAGQLGDGGCDAYHQGRTYQVKFNYRPAGELYIRKQTPADRLVLAVGTGTLDRHVPRLCFVGWLSRAEFARLAVPRDWGGYGRTTLSVPQSALRPMPAAFRGAP